MKLSKEKGKRGEREVAKLLQEFGFAARRGQQFAGGGDSPDVVHNMEGLHIEVKFREAFSLYSSLDQAQDDMNVGEVPVVFHRKSHRQWVAILDARDFLKMMQEIYE